MSDLIEISLSFPTVVFTVLSLISVGYWLVSAMLGFVEVGGDFDPDLDIDADINFDGDADVPVSEGFGLGSIAGVLGLHLVPVSVAVTVLSLIAWLTSVAAVVALRPVFGTGQRLSILPALAALVVALVIGGFVAGRVARMLSPVFVAQRGERHRDLVGRLCTIHTGRVDETFGQATVRNEKGDEHLIQVRCSTPNHLRAGDQALLVDVEDGIFVLSTDVAGLVD